ncbi:hypothetical protein ACT2FY_36645 [Paraburkholderia fungorum]|uniref:hypothetical protein n=1 Tax=Paraburkholderia fungorum TaxID=134537 RepID=UPI00402B4131
MDNLVRILKAGHLKGSDASGYIKGGHTASCFMDIPLSSLKYVLNEANTNPNRPRYEPYGIVVSKKFGFEYGCRP